MQDVYIVGGHISQSRHDKGNVFTISSNKYAEFNMFLDPLAAKTVFKSGLNITLIPLGTQRKVSQFPEILERLKLTRTTPEAQFVERLLFKLYTLQQSHHRYHHMVMYCKLSPLKNLWDLLQQLNLFFICRKHSWVKSLVRYSWVEIITI